MDDPDITKQNFSLFVCLHFRGGWVQVRTSTKRGQYYYYLIYNIYYSYTYVQLYRKAKAFLIYYMSLTFIFKLLVYKITVKYDRTKACSILAASLGSNCTLIILILIVFNYKYLIVNNSIILVSIIKLLNFLFIYR